MCSPHIHRVLVKWARTDLWEVYGWKDLMVLLLSVYQMADNMQGKATICTGLTQIGNRPD